MPDVKELHRLAVGQSKVAKEEVKVHILGLVSSNHGRASCLVQGEQIESYTLQNHMVLNVVSVIVNGNVTRSKSDSLKSRPRALRVKMKWVHAHHLYHHRTGDLRQTESMQRTFHS